MLQGELLIHLSHIDLDGYSCSALINKAVAGTERQVTLDQHNCDYGEVDKKIDEIIQIAKDHGDVVKILITDLNLSKAACDKLDNLNSQYSRVKVVLLDHHPLQKGVSSSTTEDIPRYDWYNLNKSIAATFMVSQHIDITFPIDELDLDGFREFSQIISAYDTFNKDNINVFRLGATINSIWYDLISKLGTTTPLALEVSNELLGRLVESFKTESTCSPYELELGLFFMVRDALANVLQGLSEGFDAEGIPTHEILADIVAMDALMNEDLLYEYKDVLVLIKPKLALLSVAANRILEISDDVSIVMVPNYQKGSVSLRSIQGGFDVNNLATTMFNGGGHKAASGGQTDVLITDNPEEALASLGFKKMNKKGI